jgi:hypothetical protein
VAAVLLLQTQFGMVVNFAVEDYDSIVVGRKKRLDASF